MVGPTTSWEGDYAFICNLELLNNFPTFYVPQSLLYWKTLTTPLLSKKKKKAFHLGFGSLHGCHAPTPFFFFFCFLSSHSFIFSKDSSPPFRYFLLDNSEKWRFLSPPVGVVLSPFVGGFLFTFCGFFFFGRLLMF